MYVLQKRIKICENCGMEYQPTGNCQKYCPDCKREMDLQRMRTRHYRTYVHKGYNQSGKNNNKFKATPNSRKIGCILNTVKMRVNVAGLH